MLISDWSSDGFSSDLDPALVREYAASYTRGLQDSFESDANAVASVKPFLADGGTTGGADQGLAETSLADLINIHGQGYFRAIGPGAQPVMASSNSWTNTDTGQEHGKLHGDKALLTGELRSEDH